jgi:nucleotide-binding universal stress UspA family protein
MVVEIATSTPRIRSIFHPSDFSAASEIAFAHALKAALVAGARLYMLHVSEHGNVEWSDFPGVRSTLARWGLLPKGSPKSAVGQLGIEVTKVIAPGDKPVKACLEFLSKHPTDLIVLAVHQYEGRMRWLKERVGGPIARRAREMTLFIPHGVTGFVSTRDGSVLLRNILIPIAHKPRAQPAIEAASRLIQSLSLTSGTLYLLHVGTETDAPEFSVPEHAGWRVQRLAAAGEPVEVIVNTANSLPADLIIMTTEGPQGFLDALRGSTSERVLRGSRCALLSLPAEA